jgi:hypothetical protein
MSFVNNDDVEAEIQKLEPKIKEAGEDRDKVNEVISKWYDELPKYSPVYINKNVNSPITIDRFTPVTTFQQLSLGIPNPSDIYVPVPTCQTITSLQMSKDIADEESDDDDEEQQERKDEAAWSTYRTRNGYYPDDPHKDGVNFKPFTGISSVPSRMVIKISDLEEYQDKIKRLNEDTEN